MTNYLKNETIINTAPGTLTSMGSLSQHHEMRSMVNEETPLLLRAIVNDNGKTKNKHSACDQKPTNDSENFIHDALATMVVVLIMDVSTRRFELVAVPRTSEVAQLLSQLPHAIQDPALQNLYFTALTDLRAKRYGPRHRLPTDHTLWVALTPQLTTAQGHRHARQVLKDPDVQDTVSKRELDRMEFTAW